MDAAEAVTAQLLATEARAQALEQRVHELTAENRDLRADIYRMAQQHRPAATEAGRQASWRQA